MSAATAGSVCLSENDCSSSHRRRVASPLVFCMVLRASMALWRSIRRWVIGTGGRGGTQLKVRTQNNTLCNRSKEFLLIHLDQIWAKPWATWKGAGTSHRSVNDVSGRSSPEHPDDLHCSSVSLCGTRTASPAESQESTADHTPTGGHSSSQSAMVSLEKAR